MANDATVISDALFLLDPAELIGSLSDTSVDPVRRNRFVHRRFPVRTVTVFLVRKVSDTKRIAATETYNSLPRLIARVGCVR